MYDICLFYLPAHFYRCFHNHSTTSSSLCSLARPNVLQAVLSTSSAFPLLWLCRLLFKATSNPRSPRSTQVMFCWRQTELWKLSIAEPSLPYTTSTLLPWVGHRIFSLPVRIPSHKDECTSVSSFDMWSIGVVRDCTWFHTSGTLEARIPRIDAGPLQLHAFGTFGSVSTAHIPTFETRSILLVLRPRPLLRTL